MGDLGDVLNPGQLHNQIFGGGIEQPSLHSAPRAVVPADLAAAINRFYYLVLIIDTKRWPLHSSLFFKFKNKT